MSNLIKIPTLPPTGNDATDEAWRALIHNMELLDSGNAGIAAASAQIIDTTTGGGGGGSAGGEGGIPAAFPTIPTNVVAVSGYRINAVSWDTPNFIGYAYTQIWRQKLQDDGASGGDLGQATLIGSSSAPIFIDRNLDSDEGAYYWARHANNAVPTVYGAYHGGTGEGEYAATSQDIDVLLESFQEEAASGQVLFVTEDGDVVMDGVYIRDLSVKNAAIDTMLATKLYAEGVTVAEAIIGAAEITNAMITNIIQSSNYNQTTHVGWRLNKSGTIDAHGITIYDNNGDVLLSSGGGLSQDAIDWLGDFAFEDYLDGTNITTFIQAVAIKNALVGTAKIGAANIDDAEVGTLQIAGAAVSAIGFAQNSNIGTIPYDSWKDVCSVTINAGTTGVTIGAFTFVLFATSFLDVRKTTGDTDSVQIRFRVYDSTASTTIKEWDKGIFAKSFFYGTGSTISSQVQACVVGSDTSPAAGNHTYKFQVKADSVSNTGDDGAMLVFGTKR